jgi:GT2 family glycosyltransferase
LKLQSVKDFEIVVSEDGESEVMRSFINDYKELELVHLTQPDIGWRKNQALNNAIRNASGEYLIFIDGDCVLHHKFVENHVRFAAEKRILAGKRVKLGPNYSALFKEKINELLVLEGRVASEKRAVMRDGAKFYEEAFYVNPDGWLGFIPKLRKMSQLKGCNMSCYRSALEAINGFDEDYKLPAIGEDIDLTWRFRGLGFNLFSLRNMAVQYHLHHKEGWSDQSENEAIMAVKKRNQEYVCKNGLHKIDALISVA